MTSKADALLALAAKIVQAENELEVLRAEFLRLAERTAAEAERKERRRRDRLPPREGSLVAAVLAFFRERAPAGEELRAREVVFALAPPRDPTTVYATMANMAARGRLVRPRFGVYRLPSPTDGGVHPGGRECQTAAGDKP